MALNTGFFKGKTVFISGGSRGIGLAIGKKLAKDGANIVIAAKTAEPHPSLPGTIYTAAKEIEEVGGQCLPVIMDVRKENDVESAVNAAVKRFGGIDILINNASAISLTSTDKTDMKKFDLMHQINTRGTFLLSKTCYPYLKKAGHAHILNISPPLDMESRWFGPHVAYTMAKYGMSMCVLGMAREYKEEKIAVNALWPRTTVWTAAIKMTTSGKDVDVMKHCRKDTIMADAAYVILSKPTDFTGKFLLDDATLVENGVTDLDEYAIDKTQPLQTDAFVPGAPYGQGPFLNSKI